MVARRSQQRKLLRQFVGRHNRQPLMRGAARLAESFLKAWWNEANWDMALNGEQRLLAHIIQANEGNQQLIVDIGANRGEWSKRVLALNPTAEIYAFEIVPATFEHAVRSLATFPNAHVINLGMSDKQGEVPVTYYPDNDTGSSIAGAPWYAESVTLTCPVDTFDSFAESHRLSCIEMLKIDVEGHELSVLKGMVNTLKRGMIKTIQFEYGRHFIYSKSTLIEIYEILEPLGFIIGRVFPTYVHFKGYDLGDENFRSGNFLATRDPAIAAALG